MKQVLQRHRRIVSEGFWAVGGQAIMAISMLVYTRLVTQFVGKSAFGEVSLLLPIETIGKTLLCSPIVQAAMMYYHDYHRTGELYIVRQTATVLLRRSMIVASLAMLVGGMVYRLFRPEPGLLAFGFLVCFFLADVPRALEAGMLQMARRQAALTIINSLEALARPVIVIGCVLLLGANSPSIMLAFLLLAIVALWASVRLFPQEGVGGPPAEHQRLRKLMRQFLVVGAPLAPMAVASWITSVSDRYIIGVSLGKEQTASYAAAYFISQPFLMSQGVIARVLQPVYYHAVAHDDRARQRRTFQIWLAAAVGICLSGLVGVVLLKRWIVLLLLGPEYRADALVLMPWIALGYCFHAVGAMLESILSAHKRTGRILVSESITALVAFVAPLVMVRVAGLRGVAMACPIYFSVMALTMALLTIGARRKQPGPQQK